MIVDLPTTNSSKINKALVDMREKGGSVALGRVLTLVIVTDEADSEDPIAAANAASFEHPCRVIVVALGSKRASAADGLRRSGSAVTPAPVRWWCSGCTACWSTTAPRSWCRCCWPTPRWSCGGPVRRRRCPPRIRSACSPSAGSPTPHRRSDRSPSWPSAVTTYRPGDTDLAWTRITRWRGLLASTLDQPPHDKVIGATVAGAADSPSADLLAGWLALCVEGAGQAGQVADQVRARPALGGPEPALR